MSPLFSILIANYNNGAYLLECIDSVLKQSYDNWEIVIVDDKSTDISLEVYKNVQQNPRIRIYYNESNRGVGFTKHRLIELARGDFFGFLDADDRLEQNAIEIMVKEHLCNPQCSLINSSYRLLTDRQTLSTPPYAIGQIKNDPNDILLSIGTRVGHFATIKRDAYRKTKGINSRLRLAEDLDLYLKMEEVGEIRFLNTPLYQYRIDNLNSISIGEDKKNLNLYHVAKVRLEAYARRINGRYKNMNLYRNLYIEYMYVEMKRILRYSGNFTNTILFKYMPIYIKLSGYTIKSMKRMLKIFIDVILGYDRF